PTDARLSSPKRRKDAKIRSFGRFGIFTCHPNAYRSKKTASAIISRSLQLVENIFRQAGARQNALFFPFFV
ncbi:MAG: hypothetical protein PUC33_02945, partial [Oscillospiraceae bacterium]|nr:hypothetical protein [Oscillospiraceae bacterium]